MKRKIKVRLALSVLARTPTDTLSRWSKQRDARERARREQEHERERQEIIAKPARTPLEVWARKKALRRIPRY